MFRYFVAGNIWLFWASLLVIGAIEHATNAGLELSFFGLSKISSWAYGWVVFGAAALGVWNLVLYFVSCRNGQTTARGSQEVLTK